ncbi:hypothetical protein MPTK1_1g08910 [Marchantia polymorpha subsp. ruderalis]|uniref:Uncharacterized protein n=2 Tax=Marchantia polymorpha TaxID=3197 RepID=A0A176WN74_MARPO|nr:hypothetical protein AXG93_3235s1070 [Marchantia polymorpha subsp. ruderalis]PTQ41159.1 hypothetical protein MARPO_0036s0131 [Marchantia polymorpha]BBM97858.1 hypothetical protein Mp_1g08910 [Marchantia polymorpha subsp. ruderalis]|eukprot:PTQ41159.1 hypothetical protein MARPO_0036s0131 [Marchantia polymorpha]
MPAREDSQDDGHRQEKGHAAEKQQVVPMGSLFGSGFLSEMKEKLGPSVDMLTNEVSRSAPLDAARRMFGSKDQQQIFANRLVICVVPPAGAAFTFGATLLGAQVAGAGLRVSCATPVMASVVGFMALGTASAAAAQVSHSLRRFYGQGKMNGGNEYLAKDTLLVNALFGIVAFKVLGGSFHRLMPSNVNHPGALHSVSIPARGSKYANDIEQVLIQDMFKRHGCHHCGKRAGESIADHMPPNVIAHGRGWAKAVVASGEANSFLARLRSTIPFLPFSPKVVHQRLYPQCTDCSKLQSAALRHGKRGPLVFHFKRGVPEAPFFTGFCIGSMRIDDSVTDDARTSR